MYYEEEKKCKRCGCILSKRCICYTSSGHEKDKIFKFYIEGEVKL
jgi:hypothetical protein